MYNTFTSRHPIHRMRFYFHFVTKGISVHDAAFKQKSKRRKSYVRMRQNIKIIPFTKFHRAHVIYINKWAYHTFLAERQQTPHHKATNLSGSFFYNEIDI